MAVKPTRETILEKVKKWSSENGGATPSEKVIRDEIGIPKWHWISYWVKTTDLQRDAGLKPHVFDKTKFTSDDLCKLFIRLIREIKKWPSRDDVDFKRRQDKTFPSNATFVQKFGLKKELAHTILEFSKKRKGYKDIIEICESVLKKYDEQTEKDDSNLASTRGWVYLIKHGNRNEYRIGQTTNLLRRLGENKIQLPEESNSVHTIETIDPVGVETYWLNRFKTRRLNGDWFRLSSADVAEFKRWKKIC